MENNSSDTYCESIAYYVVFLLSNWAKHLNKHDSYFPSNYSAFLAFQRCSSLEVFHILYKW